MFAGNNLQRFLLFPNPMRKQSFLFDFSLHLGSGHNDMLSNLFCQDSTRCFNLELFAAVAGAVSARRGWRSIVKSISTFFKCEFKISSCCLKSSLSRSRSGSISPPSAMISKSLQISKSGITQGPNFRRSQNNAMQCSGQAGDISKAFDGIWKVRLPANMNASHTLRQWSRLLSSECELNKQKRKKKIA